MMAIEEMEMEQQESFGAKLLENCSRWTEMEKELPDRGRPFKRKLSRGSAQ